METATTVCVEVSVDQGGGFLPCWSADNAVELSKSLLLCNVLDIVPGKE